MVNGKLAVQNFLEIVANVAEPEVQALEGLELRGDTCRECADGDVANVSEEVLDADLFRFFGFDCGGGMDEGFGGGSAILVARLALQAELKSIYDIHL